jgi:hypothetical protein
LRIGMFTGIAILVLQAPRLVEGGNQPRG